MDDGPSFGFAGTIVISPIFLGFDFRFCSDTNYCSNLYDSSQDYKNNFFIS